MNKKRFLPRRHGEKYPKNQPVENQILLKREKIFRRKEAHPALAGAQPAFALSTHKRWPQARRRRVTQKSLFSRFLAFCGQTPLDFFSRLGVFVASLVPACPG
jgi:hypothetical protein